MQSQTPIKVAVYDLQESRNRCINCEEFPDY